MIACITVRVSHLGCLLISRNHMETTTLCLHLCGLRYTAPVQVLVHLTVASMWHLQVINSPQLLWKHLQAIRWSEPGPCWLPFYPTKACNPNKCVCWNDLLYHSAFLKNSFNNWGSGFSCCKLSRLFLMIQLHKKWSDFFWCLLITASLPTSQLSYWYKREIHICILLHLWIC